MINEYIKTQGQGHSLLKITEIVKLNMHSSKATGFKFVTNEQSDDTMASGELQDHGASSLEELQPEECKQ